jgi:Predicted transcriptional regulators
MEIGKQIKKRRAELGLTQEELAQRLNVARTTVSNWEIDRNYPDLGMVVKISEVLDISLDELLKGGSDLVEKITDDTKVRKIQSKKMKILYAVIGVLILIGLYWGYRGIKGKDIPIEKIVSVGTFGTVLEIEVDLPFYRSIDSYMVGSSLEGADVVELSLGSVIDWSMTNEEKIIVDLNGTIWQRVKIIDGSGNYFMHSPQWEE